MSSSKPSKQLLEESLPKAPTDPSGPGKMYTVSGECLGPASYELQQAYLKNGGRPVPYPYHGYTLMVTVK